jgi:hypothetical protein
MSLDYDVREVKRECVVDGRLDDVTAMLIWTVLAIHLTAITEKNVDEWAWRCAFLDEIGRTGMGPDGRWPTKEEIREHVGLRTNMGTLTRTVFVNMIVKGLKKNADWKSR